MVIWFFMPIYKRASFQCPFINRPLPIYKRVCYFWNLFVNGHVSRCLFTNGQATIWFIVLYYKANCFTLNQLFMVLTTNITTGASRGANLLCLLACTMLCITFSLAVTLKKPLSTCHWQCGARQCQAKTLKLLPFKSFLRWPIPSISWYFSWYRCNTLIDCYNVISLH
jgi:hypothetical protein